MLQLSPNITELNQLTNNVRHGMDSSFISVEGLPDYNIFDGTRMRGKSCGCPDLPYIFNFKNYKQESISLQANSEAPLPDVHILNNILDSYINLACDLEDPLIYLRLYCYNLNVLDICDNINQFEKHDEDQVAITYKKCMDDTAERNETVRDIGAVIYNHKELNLVIEVVDYEDTFQGSDYFLTLGMMPALLPRIKEKFDEIELKYFKEFVRRSQVKRIRNVEVENFYWEVCRRPKYTERIKEIKFKATIEGILRNRRYNAQNQIDNLDTTLKRLLEQYEETIKQYDNARQELDRLQHNEDTVVEDINTVSRLAGVHSLDIEGTNLIIKMRTALEYYDPEIADMVLSKKQKCKAVDFLKEVFVEQKYKMMVGQAFRFSFDTNNNLRLPDAISGTNIPRNLQCLFNPHLEFYRCYGDNEPTLIQAHRKKDVINFANSALVSLKNVNFADSAVINRWIDALDNMFRNLNYNYDTTFLEVKSLVNTETNTEVSLKEWLDAYTTKEMERIQARFVEEAEELEPTEVGVAPELNEEFRNEEEDEL